MVTPENVNWFISHGYCHVNNPGQSGVVLLGGIFNRSGYVTGKGHICSYLIKKEWKLASHTNKVLCRSVHKWMTLILELLQFIMWYITLNHHLFRFVLVYWTMKDGISGLWCAVLVRINFSGWRGHCLHSWKWQPAQTPQWKLTETMHHSPHMLTLFDFFFWNGPEPLSQYSIAKMLHPRQICKGKVKLLVCITGEGDLNSTTLSWNSDKIHLPPDTAGLQFRKPQQVVLWWWLQLSAETQ